MAMPSPTKIAEEILGTTTPLAEACRKLAENPMGNPEGKGKAGANASALADYNSAVNAAVSQYQQSLGHNASVGLGSSSARQGQ
jgi:hypothetical protein